MPSRPTLRLASLLLTVFACSGAWAQSSTEPCIEAGPKCEQWIKLGTGAARTKVYASWSLTQKNERLRRAFIYVHGQGRDADNYFRHALAAAFLAGALQDTLIISPRLASHDGKSCRDKLADNEVNWICGGAGSWRSGGTGTEDKSVTSFDVGDTLLKLLADKQVFPNLTHVVLGGHSAGGQYATRYAMANQVHEKLGLDVHYVVSNPSSYTYLDSVRPTVAAYPAQYAHAAPGYQAPLPETMPAPFAAYASAPACPGYDDFPYGATKRVGYAAKQDDAVLKRQLASRPVTYLLGEIDILPLYGFDSSCAAMAQGPTRLARGLAYARYANEKLGAKHNTVVVPACGHSARCMATAEASLKILFPATAK